MSNTILAGTLLAIFSIYGAAYADVSYEKPVERWDFTAAQDPLGWTELHSVAPDR